MASKASPSSTSGVTFHADSFAVMLSQDGRLLRVVAAGDAFVFPFLLDPELAIEQGRRLIEMGEAALRLRAEDDSTEP